MVFPGEFKLLSSSSPSSPHVNHFVSRPPPPSPPDASAPSTGEDCTPDSNAHGVSSISAGLEADGQLDSLYDWLVEDPYFGKASEVHIEDMKSFSPAFPIDPTTANGMNMPQITQITPFGSLLFNSPPSPSTPPATFKRFQFLEAVYPQAFSEWWDDPLFKGAYPSESLLLAYKLHSQNCTAGDCSNIEDSEMSHSQAIDHDLLSDSSSLLLSSASSGSSDSDRSRNNSADIYDNVEHTVTKGASIATEIPDLHSPVHTPFDSSPHLVLPSVPPATNTTGPASDAPLESSSPGHHGRTSTRLKAIRASPYPKSLSLVRRHSAGIPDSVSRSNILRKTSLLPSQTHADKEGLATAVKSIPDNDTADLFSPSRPSPTRRSTKRSFPCTHPDCAKTFTRKHDLTKHLRNVAVHNSESDSDSICRRCGASLSRKDACQRHQRAGACGKRKTSRKAAFLPLQVS